MKLKLFLPILLIGLLSTSILHGETIQGNGKSVTKQINISSYNKIEYGEGIHSRYNSGKNREKPVGPIFHYTQKSGNVGLEITMDENLFPYLDIKSENGTLTIKTLKGKKIFIKHFVVNSHSDNLEYIKLNDGNDLNIVSSLTTNKLEVESHSGGDVRMKEKAQINTLDINLSGGSDLYAQNLECSELRTKLSGGSDLHITKGKAEKASLKASGGSDIHAYNFVVNTIDCKASGGSDMFLHATQSLSGSASGGSDIHYKGGISHTINLSGGSDCYKK